MLLSWRTFPLTDLHSAERLCTALYYTELAWTALHFGALHCTAQVGDVLWMHKTARPFWEGSSEHTIKCKFVQK